MSKYRFGRVDSRAKNDLTLKLSFLLLDLFRTQFEEYVSKGHFVEHGEYEKSYYGTSLDSIR